jgi:hypothetical protein
VKPRRGSTRIAALQAAPEAEVLAATSGPRSGASELSAVERGRRTAAAVAAVPAGWQWPRWLDRQLRPEHPAFVPPGDAVIVENVTGRDWRYVGTVSSGWLAMVDPRGAVVPGGGGWSLDWLVRGDDRWHLPAREAAVRQRMLGEAPVVETACRVPGGDILQRVFGATASGELGDVVVVEVENTTAAPVAVAFAIRPADLLGAGTISTLALDDNRVLVDGRPALLFDRRPARAALGDATTDAVARIVDATDDEVTVASVRDPLGLANAAFVVPLPHRSSVRVVLPAQLDRRARPSGGATVPASAAIVRGWQAHADRGATIELPDERVNRVYGAAVRNLLLASGDGAVAAPHGREDDWTVADEARIVRALHAAGLHDAANAVLRRRGDEFELDGWYRREPPSLGRNAALFLAIGDAWTMSGDRSTIDAVLGPAAKAAHWSERYRARRPRSIATADAYAMHDALLALARALAGVEQIEAAQDVAAFAARFVLDHETVLTETVPGDLPVVAPRGLDSAATAALGTVLARSGDERALVALGWLDEVGGTSGRWPTYVHPRLGTGSGGCGDDPVVSAAVVELARALAVREDDRSLALLPVVPAAWFGRPVDVRNIPTRHGRCSFSLRWHGERPALLWELDGDRVADGLEITTPALDGTFRTVERAGEALLAPPAGAGSLPAQPGASFG